MTPEEMRERFEQMIHQTAQGSARLAEDLTKGEEHRDWARMFEGGPFVQAGYLFYMAVQLEGINASLERIADAIEHAPIPTPSSAPTANRVNGAQGEPPVKHYPRNFRPAGTDQPDAMLCKLCGQVFAVETPRSELRKHVRACGRKKK